MTDIANTVESIGAANPVPSQHSLPAGALSPDGLLAMIDERSLAMTSTQPHIRPTDHGKRSTRLRGPLVAVVAGVVILMLGLTTLTVLTGGDKPVTDDPQPTAIEAPMQQGAPLEIVNGFITARNQHSAEGMLSYLAADATVDGDLTTTTTGYARVVEFERITGWEFTLGDCREVTPAPDEARLQCPFTFENDWSRALDLGPIGTSRTAFTFTILDHEIERVAMVLDVGEVNFEVPGQNYTAVNDPFVEWLDRTHPDDKWALFSRSQCFPGGACVPLLTDEALELWEQYSDEFVEFAISQGTPDQ